MVKSLESRLRVVWWSNSVSDFWERDDGEGAIGAERGPHYATRFGFFEELEGDWVDVPMMDSDLANEMYINMYIGLYL